jgi:hypothetical protein
MESVAYILVLTMTIAVLFFMGWNALLVLQYESAMIPSEAPVTMAQIVQNQLFVIPHFIHHVLKN